MKPVLDRRKFLARSAHAGMACCAVMFASKLHALGWSGELRDGEKPDPKKLEYCGYVCPPDCKLLKGSLEKNDELKKEAYTLWEMKERFGVEFEPEKIYCFGCKNKGKPDGIVLKHCTVRACAREKGLDCCIECNELADCDEDLWTRFPEFRKYVLDLQQKYQVS